MKFPKAKRRGSRFLGELHSGGVWKDQEISLGYEKNSILSLRTILLEIIFDRKKELSGLDLFLRCRFSIYSFCMPFFLSTLIARVFINAKRSTANI
ncbi:hypothetical protein LEP1GSC058_1449 [Leptospira fainei serovar Hurstbridge str. BUT 6]|uniref:Uncharacterized protein n=1 Tax=Leptospira fainei serovar Hurstbridge str. BUT 6 TaxID=1193011 RepID=S3V4U3_9LEPT|nr:hypothetical protein LEP1GSC058_1449 [Leptospira fainei serovar Hurstbridge str. BUT 6]